jgi:hypothetical protein
MRAGGRKRPPKEGRRGKFFEKMPWWTLSGLLVDKPAKKCAMIIA